MRDIKFRSWDKENKSMHYEINSQITGDITLDLKPHVFNVRTLGELELMQYTGLKDKNGKEIYEGDIIELNPDITVCRLAKIIFKDGAYQYEYLTKPQAPDAYRFEYHKMKEHEILGNIYENPELLK